MQCKVAWSKDFLNKNFSKYFLNGEYREMCEKVIFEEEKTHLPALQEEADRRVKIEKIKGWFSYYIEEKKKNNENEDQFVREQRRIDKEITDKENELQIKYMQLIRKVISKEHKIFTMKCTVENCRGFLSDKYKCGLCKTDICKDCHCVKTDEHECNKDDVATVIELNKTTKPCPKCQVRIFKTDGCDQMFCIQCHTAFSWKTGLVESGVVHNPHYFEALRNGKITDTRHRQYQGECGPIPSFVDIHHVLRRNRYNDFLYNVISSFYQRVVHNRNVIMPALLLRANEDEDRIKYLIGKYDDKKFKQKLYVRHQTNLRKREEQQIMELYTNISEEFLRRIKHDAYVSKTISEEILNLVKITVVSIKNLDDKYNHAGFSGLYLSISNDLDIVKDLPYVM